MRALKVGAHGYRLEFHYIGGPRPYLRIGRPDAAEPEDEYAGSIDGAARIRVLRDYLTRALRSRPR